MSALRPIPELNYECADGQNDFDEKLLKRPVRRAAITKLIRSLESLNNESWWQTSVADLNACDFRKDVGTLTDDESQRFRDGEYQTKLFGNDRFRLVVISDPCYQTGYGGSSLFLLHRTAGRVFASLVIDGYYTRADNSVGLAFAEIKGQEIIEISTGTGGLHPYLTNHYFIIDPRTKCAVPRNLFKVGRILTNKITSAALLSEPDDSRYPSELKVIIDKKLAPVFSAYVESERETNDEDGRHVSRRIYRWNGRYYQMNAGRR
ncbi:MAG TPA: hypothetical protein VJU86_09595 [Pyrinomonadaceae bacterium]|nr:hypothetical protein [Pyrinomonadaceae bacterium]